MGSKSRSANFIKKHQFVRVDVFLFLKNKARVRKVKLCRVNKNKFSVNSEKITLSYKLLGGKI